MTDVRHLFTLSLAEQNELTPNVSPATLALHRIARLTDRIVALEVASAEKAVARLVVLARRLGATEGQLAQAHGDRLEVRRILDESSTVDDDLREGMRRTALADLEEQLAAKEAQLADALSAVAIEAHARREAEAQLVTTQLLLKANGAERNQAVHPDDCLNCERDGNPLWCSALVCDIHDDDETARFGMMATLLFRNGERREEPCDELRRRWRMARDFDQTRVYTGRWGAIPRGSVWPVAEVNEDA